MGMAVAPTGAQQRGDMRRRGREPSVAALHPLACDTRTGHGDMGHGATAWGDKS